MFVSFQIGATKLSKTVGWLQGSPVCSQANTALIYILTNEMWSTHQHAVVRFIIVPYHLQTAEERKNKSWWLKLSEVEYLVALQYCSIQVNFDTTNLDATDASLKRAGFALPIPSIPVSCTLKKRIFHITNGFRYSQIVRCIEAYLS